MRSEDSQNFSEHPYIGRIARSSVRQLSCLVLESSLCRSIHTVSSEIAAGHNFVFVLEKLILASILLHSFYWYDSGFCPLSFVMNSQHRTITLTMGDAIEGAAATYEIQHFLEEGKKRHTKHRQKKWSVFRLLI